MARSRSSRSREVVGIAEDAITFALEASRETHPDEYMGFLRGEDARDLGLARDGLVATEVLIIPGTTSNPVSATVKSDMIPNDGSAIGSIHSHPNGVLRPSDADLATFGSGRVHIIVGAPYERGDWQAFDRQGDPRRLEVVDVATPHDEDHEDFFDFTQEDIDRELGLLDGGQNGDADDDEDGGEEDGGRRWWWFR